jgi:hypothetical protein
METQEELYYDKARLLANGDRWEKIIAKKLELDALPVSARRHIGTPELEPRKNSRPGERGSKSSSVLFANSRSALLTRSRA